MGMTTGSAEVYGIHLAIVRKIHIVKLDPLRFNKIDMEIRYNKALHVIKIESIFVSYIFFNFADKLISCSKLPIRYSAFQK